MRFALVAIYALGCASPRAEPARPGTEPAAASAASSPAASSPAATLPPVAPPPPQLAPPLVRGGIGQRAPSTVVAASPAGDWVSLCQARQDTDGDGQLRVSATGHGDPEGDGLRQYFVERGGEGEPIDAFVGHDPTGRFVALLRQGRLVLRDTHAALETDLSQGGADVRGDLLSYAGHRAGSFDPEGRRFAYLRRESDRALVVVRALATGAEEPISVGEGSAWRVEFEPEGAYLRVNMVPRDTNGDRKLNWPAPYDSEARHRCPLPIPRFVVPGREPDRVATLLYRLSDGSLLERAGLVSTLGAGILTRNDALELWLESEGGERRLVAPKECRGRVLHAHAPSGNVLVGCASEYGQRRRLYLSTPSKQVRLGYEVAAFESDGRFPHAARLLLLNPGNESILLDMATGAVHELTAGSAMLASIGEFVLMTRKDRLYWLAADGSERALDLSRPAFARVRQAGPHLTVGRLWFAAPGSSPPVTLPSEPLALATSGRVLLASAPDRAGAALPSGPLEWFDPARASGGPAR